MPLVLLAIVAYYALSGNASAAPTTKSNVVSIIMSAPANMVSQMESAPPGAKQETMRALAKQFGWPATPEFIYDATLETPSSGTLIFSLGFRGDMPKLPVAGQTFSVLGLPIKIVAVSIAPARV